MRDYASSCMSYIKSIRSDEMCRESVMNLLRTRHTQLSCCLEVPPERAGRQLTHAVLRCPVPMQFNVHNS